MERRDIIKGALCFAFTAYAGNAGARSAVTQRSLKIHNPRFNETVNVVYWQNGNYLAQGLSQLNNITRDHHLFWRDQKAGRNPYARSVIQMQPRLFDFLFNIKHNINRRYPRLDVTFNMLSGYRSPETNEMLRRTRGGQAIRSRHMYGDAMDTNVPGVPLRELRDIAYGLRMGGVGYYPKSNFVHVDTAGFRKWGW